MLAIVTASVHPRLENLLASLSLNLTDEADRALEDAARLTGSGTAALLALQEFLGGTHVGRLAEVLGLTHSGAVRLVSQLESDGLAERRVGTDRRRVEVRLTARGRQRARAARKARDAVVHETVATLSDEEAETLEALVAKLVERRVSLRLERREAGASAPWWCRTCNFTACGRPDGHCPAQVTAARFLAGVEVEARHD